jgi:hypothetical protein
LALRASLARDRADWAALPGWAKSLAVVRGLLDRAVLRILRRGALRERDWACVAQGLESDDPEVRLARERRAGLAMRVGRMPLAAREAAQFSRALLRETRGQILPRVPALVGLGVGFWVAQTFTDSGFSATLHSWGIGDGPRYAVESETLHAMRFWLPLLAAALTSYVGARVAALVRSRYAPSPDVVAPGEDVR